MDLAMLGRFFVLQYACDVLLSTLESKVFPHFAH